VSQQLGLEEQIEQLIEDIEIAKEEYEEFEKDINKRVIKIFKGISEENIPYHSQTQAIILSKRKKELESSLKELQSLYSKHREFLAPSLCERVEKLLVATRRLVVQ
jgi:archaellum component FlaC